MNQLQFDGSSEEAALKFAQETKDRIEAAEKEKEKPLEGSLEIDNKADTNGKEPSLVVDMDQLLISDLETLDRASAKKLPTSELIKFLDRIVVGGVRHLPLRRLGDIIEALGEAVTEAANPTSAAGN